MAGLENQRGVLTTVLSENWYQRICAEIILVALLVGFQV